MQYLLCNINFLSEDVLNNHYVWQHLVNENDVYFNDLFKPDTNYRRCDICQIDFGNLRIRKSHMFLFHYDQTGSKRGKSQLPINILRRGPIMHFTISYDQRKNFYNFFKEQIVDDFLDSVYARFDPDYQYKIQGYTEIINQQQGELIIAENTRVLFVSVLKQRKYKEILKILETDLYQKLIFCLLQKKKLT